MKKFHRLCKIVAFICIANFVISFIILLIFGGSGNWGKVVGDHYYVGHKGSYHEVTPTVYWFTYYQGISVSPGVFLAMLAGMLYTVTGGASSSYTSSTEFEPGKLRHKSKYRSIRRLYWRVIDFIEEIIWFFLDRWRKPTEEWFVPRSRKECILELKRLNEYYLSTGQLVKPVRGFFSGKHFSLRKANETFRILPGSNFRPVVTGRFTCTPQGVYIRIWHRFAADGIAFITFFLGSILSALTLYGIARLVLNQNPAAHLDYVITLSALVVLPFFYIITLMVSVWLGAVFGYEENRDIVDCVLNTFGK